MYLYFWMLVSSVLLLADPSNVFSQISGDTRVASRAHEIHREAFRRQHQLFNGRAYKEIPLNPNRDIGHPFFLTDELTFATLDYDGVLYDSIELLYDIVQDQIVIEYPLSSSRLALVNEHIRFFNLENHLFLNIRPDQSSGIKAGLYEILYSENTRVYAKRMKVIFESNHNTQLQNEFLKRDEFVILKDGIFYPVSDRKSVLAVFSDLSKDSLKDISVSFKKDPEKFVVAAAKLYDKRF